MWPRRELVEYSVEHAIVGGEDRFLILHNDGAENFTLVEAPVSDPTAFRTLIEHRDDVRLDAVDAFEGHLVVSYRSEALPRIQLWPIYADGDYGHPEDLTFDSELMSAGLGGNPNWSSPKLRIGATSFVTPVRIYDVDLATGERTLLREQPVLGDYRPEDYVERRDWAVAADGARSADLDHPPHRPAVPGADAAVRLRRLRVVRGPAVLHRPAVAARPRHGVRGRARPRRRRARQAVVRARQAAGEEEHLHRLHRCRQQHLVDTDITRPENLVALGGSAGGLLMGAVANMAPELFAGILAQVPFVDALTTILDPSLPLTVTEWDEWGNPLEDEDVYHYMKSYSPYENVEAKDYPPILAMTSLNDTRVLLRRAGEMGCRAEAHQDRRPPRCCSRPR